MSGIAPEAPSVLSNVVIDGGGVLADSNTIHIVNSVIRNGPYHGIQTYSGAQIQVSGTLIENNAGTGVYTDGPLLGPFTGNTITGNGIAVEILSGDGNASAIDVSNVIAGNELDVVRIRGATMDADTTLHALDVPFRISHRVRVGGLDGATLTIDAGTIVEFEAEAAIELGYLFPIFVPPEWPGRLLALGTAEAPIIFRSAADFPVAGDWRGLLFREYAMPSVLDYTVIQHAGFETSGAIVTNTDALTITNCEISDNEGWGISNEGGVATQSGNTFMNNSSGDVSP